MGFCGVHAGFVVDRHLSTANVRPGSFGNATFFPADGQMYPQVLFAPRMWVAGAQRDMAFGATERSSVYAWDLSKRAALPFLMVCAENTSHASELVHSARGAR